MTQEFLNHITKKKLFKAGDKILLAVSGGLDSMAMVRLFQECKFEIGVAHANFQLRGEESNDDQKFVEGYCSNNSMPFFTKKFDTETYAKENGLSIQMAARQLRYAWFDELLHEHHFDFVATAHHLNDAIETVLLSSVRGSGLEGFDGISSKNKKVIRPLLFAARQAIEDYAKTHHIQWREDRSNASNDYSRNFIRHNVYPLLKQLNPSLEQTFDESMNKIAGAVELADLGASQWKNEFEEKKGDQILLKKNGFDQFAYPEAVLWNLIKGFGFNLDQCTQIITALHGQPGKIFSSPQFELVIDRNLLIISKKKTDLQETLIQFDQSEVSLGNYKMKIESKEEFDIESNPKVALLDASGIQFPLRWRKWKDGDSFHPLGMTHRKKLSDFLIDQKISVTDKENVTVLVSGSEIVWVVGHRIDERFKVSDSSKGMIRVSVIS